MDALESVKRHVAMMHFVEIKRPVAEQVFAGLHTRSVESLFLVLVAIELATSSLPLTSNIANYVNVAIVSYAAFIAYGVRLWIQ